MRDRGSMSPAVDPPRRPLLHGWRGLLILTSLTIVLALIAIGVWSMSDRDLRRVEAEIAAAGLPMTWAGAGIGLGERKSPDMERLEALEQRLRPWQRTITERIEPGLPIPTSVGPWHAALPIAELTEVAQLIDRAQVDRSIPPRGKRGWDGYRRPRRNLAITLRQCLAVAPASEVRTSAHRLVRLLAIVPRFPEGWNGALQAGMASDTVKHLAVRLPELKGDVDLARALIAIADRFEAERDEEAICHLVWLSDLCWNFPRYTHSLSQRLGMRLVRERLLRLQLTWLLRSRSCRPGFERHDLATRLMDAATARPPALLDIDFGFGWGRSWWDIMADPRAIEKACTAASLRLRLLAAEITGDPWPADPYSRSGDRLRRIERDGVLIGGYSIGPDEHDAGGGKGDISLALYGPLKPPSTMPPATP